MIKFSRLLTGMGRRRHDTADTGLSPSRICGLSRSRSRKERSP
ncbi:hypothetical protein [Geomonas subterranea]|nr:MULTISPECIES: hypothetical protein [Geomonas]